MNLLGARVLASKGPEHWRAFSRDWFRQNQAWLLWALNTPVLARLVRHMLRIDMRDVWMSRGTQIWEIAPNHYTVRLPDGQFRSDFRGHDKYSKRLYYSWKPLWWALHYFDAAFADKWAPSLSYGFATLTVYPDPHPETSTVDGHAYRNVVPEAWATIIAGAGTAAGDSTSNFYVAYVDGGDTTDTWGAVYRGIVLFDTSSLGAGAAISAAVLSIRGNDKFDTAGRTPNVDVYTSTPASNTALVAGDYSQIGSVSQTGAPITYANWSTVGYNDWAFNGTGIANVSLTGVSKFGLRNANYDVAAIAPPWINTTVSALEGKAAETAGTTTDPKLVVTYTAAATVGGPLVGGRLTNSSLLVGGRLIR